MAEHTTTNAQHFASTQPNSRLHRFPIELQGMIFAFVVISPTPIPARVHLKDVETPSDNADSNDDISNADSNDGSSPATFTTLVKIDPSQPALSRIDSHTRPIVLRIFYTKNTFLFRTHAYVEGPLRKWLDATEHNYAPEARMIRRVMLEMSVAKTCGVQPQPQLLVTSRRGTPNQQRHLYHVLVSEQPGDEGVRVGFGADLAAMCGCAMRTAGLIKPVPRARSLFCVHDSATSSALSFAYDVEYDIVLTNECKYHFCCPTSSSTCWDCGLRVHRGEPLGAYLLERTRKQVQDEAERAEREKVLAEERARMHAEMAESTAALQAGIAALRAQAQGNPQLRAACVMM